MDLDTLLTTVYVLVDDWYKQASVGEKTAMGNPGQLSDSEVLTLGLVAQWRVGVPWRSERGMVRYMLRQGRAWFPKMLQVSGYNYRFRQLWHWFVRLQQALAEQLGTPQDIYETVDSVPLLPTVACKDASTGNDIGFGRRAWATAKRVGSRAIAG
ncbi:MAG: hypothetical protein GC204_19300 [Chloroflexi bacterium]|nr:hypothetical protein [Chloroflexota bacterium]